LTSEDKIRAAYGSTIELMRTVDAEVRRTVRDQTEALRRPLADLERDRVAAEQKLKELETRRTHLEQTIKGFGNTVKALVYANLRDYVDELSNTWPQYARTDLNLDQLKLWDLIKSFASDEAKKKVSDILKREIEKYLERSFEVWAQRLPVLL